MTDPAAQEGWYPAADRPGSERFWDGHTWTGAYRPLAPAASPAAGGLSAIAPALKVLALALLLAGVYVGFGWHANSIGVDGATLDDIAKAHAVDCGTAFHITFNSVTCQQALSGRKTTAIVLLAVGAALFLISVPKFDKTKLGA